MLHSPVTPHDRRERFRAALERGDIQRLPGAFTPLSARLIQQHGFEGVYISGGVMANELGLPDIGLTSVTEGALRAQQIARTTDLPTIVDADTGFGEPINVARTVQQLEDAGVTALHVEDQVNPKRCGHLAGKAVVDEATAVRRIRAAVSARRDATLLVIARTDIRAVDGIDAVQPRLDALVEAGADAVFPEALESLDEFAAVCARTEVPVLANMTEFGRSDLFSATDLEAAGVRIVIFPVSMQRLAMGAIERGLEALARDGSLTSQVSSMQTRARLYEVVDYDEYARFDQGVADFR